MSTTIKTGEIGGNDELPPWKYLMFVEQGALFEDVYPINTHYVLGGSERQNETLFPYRVLKAVVSKKGPVYFRLRFTSKAEGEEYLAQYTHICDVMEDLTTKEKNHSMTRIEYEQNLKSMWIPLVTQFIEIWGPDMCMPDVRLVLNQVEHGLGMQITNFPAVEEV